MVVVVVAGVVAAAVGCCALVVVVAAAVVALPTQCSAHSLLLRLGVVVMALALITKTYMDIRMSTIQH